MADKDLNALFLDTLKDIYYAEKQIYKALPKMAKAANSDQLRTAFEKHHDETEGQIGRLEQIFELLGKPARGKKCDAIEGILDEGSEIMDEYKGEPALDAGLLAAAQAVEHYEISRYGTLKSWAGKLGMKDAVKLLDQTLSEEKKTDDALTKLADTAVNAQAAQGRNDHMKRTFATLVFASVLLTSAAYAQSVGEKTGVNSTLGIAPKTEDFIKEAAMSDMLEIEASKIAQTKGNAQEKKFAGEMITDHTKTSTELKGMVSGEMKAAIPAVLDDSSEKKLGKLRDSKPEDFAGQYDSMQVSAHKDAVSLFERYAKGGEDPKLKDWAGKTLPKLQHHLEMAQDMEKNRK